MDWFVALAPLLALILILVFGFTGCSIDRAGTATPILIDTLFFPTDDPAAPTQRVAVGFSPVDVGDRTARDFPSTSEAAVMGPDGSRSQRILFAYISGHMASVSVSVLEDGRTIIESTHIRVPAIPDGQRAVVTFTASSGATSWDTPTVMLMAI